MDALARAMEGRFLMSGENPAPRDVSQAEIDAALAAASAGSADAGAPEPSAANPATTPSQADSTSGTVAAQAATAVMEACDTTERGAHAPIPLDLPDLNKIAGAKKTQGIELLSDVELNVKIELGRATMPIEDVLRLGEGSVVELDKLAGDPVDVLVNDRLVARGEVIVLNDNFCVRISEIVATDSDVAAA